MFKVQIDNVIYTRLDAVGLKMVYIDNTDLKKKVQTTLVTFPTILTNISSVTNTLMDICKKPTIFKLKFDVVECSERMFNVLSI